MIEVRNTQKHVDYNSPSREKIEKCDGTLNPKVKSVLLMVDSELTLNGAITSRVIYLAKELEKADLSVIILGIESEDINEEKDIKNVITVRKRRPNRLGLMRSRFDLMKTAARLFHEKKISHVIVRGYMLALMILPFLKLYRISGLYDFHGYSYHVQRIKGWRIRPIISKFLQNICLSKYDNVITQNELNLELALQKSNEVIFLDNGVDITRFSRNKSIKIIEKNEILERFDIPLEKVLIGFVAGTMGGWVDLNCMLTASTFFPDSLHLVIVSGDPRIVNIDRDQYPRVTFTGRLNNIDVKNLLDIFDMCLYGIIREYTDPFYGSPRKIREWIAMELPIVMSDTKPKPSFLQEGVNALFCTPEDPEDMAEKVIQLSLDPDRRNAMRKRSREIRNAISWENSVINSGIIDILKE